MELMDLYRKIKNPLDDPKVLGMLIDAYAESPQYSGFYSSLTKRQKKENVGKYYIDASDKFYSMMFNNWKNSIVSMTKERYDHLRRLGKCGPDFIKMRNFLMTVQDVTTKKEATDIIYGNYADKELRDALENYSWNSLGTGASWEHVHSRYSDMEKRDVYEDVEHRLYLNTDPLDTLPMATYMVEKFREKNLPYYFKFSGSGGRDDTIVLYTPTERLETYIELLREIVKEHPDIASRMQRPPALTGLIEPWMGYGSEPGLDKNGENQSFNGVRSPIIEKAISNAVKRWMGENINKHMDYNGKKITVQQYFNIGLYNIMINNLRKRYNTRYKSETDEHFAQRSGYYGTDLDSQTFNQLIYNFVQAKSNDLFRAYFQGVPLQEKMTINARFGKQIELNGRYFEETMHKMAKHIARFNPMFIQTIREEIMKSTSQYGIDPNNYCFDLAAVAKLQKEDQRQRRMQPAQPNQSFTTGKVNQASSEVNEDAVTKEDLPKLINPALVNKTVKTPDGKLIPASQYLQTFVFPHLPSNGVIVLKNGTPWTVKQFIEEGILGECQTKYAGNLYQYLLEKTKTNFGVLKLKGKNDEVEIAAQELVNYLNPETLQKTITLPNRQQYSAKACISSMYLDYVPYNGEVTLKNGQHVSAKDYIEKVLIPETQTTYAGYLGNVILDTTRRNDGTIDMNPKHFEKNVTDMKPSGEGKKIAPIK